MPAIGEVIARLRARKGWSQGQLSLKTAIPGNRKAVSKGAISLLESGNRKNPHILTVARLAVALEASLDDILIEAEILSARPEGCMPGIQETQFLSAIRSITNPREKREVLDHFIALVSLLTPVPRITEEELRLVAEDRAEYTEEDQE